LCACVCFAYTYICVDVFLRVHIRKCRHMFLKSSSITQHPKYLLYHLMATYVALLCMYVSIGLHLLHIYWCVCMRCRCVCWCVYMYVGVFIHINICMCIFILSYPTPLAFAFLTVTINYSTLTIPYKCVKTFYNGLHCSVWPYFTLYAHQIKQETPRVWVHHLSNFAW
jgi:hypothetical protein